MGLLARWAALNARNENGPRSGNASRLDGAAWCGARAGAPRAQYASAATSCKRHPGPARLHLYSIRVAGVVNGWLTPIWQKLWTVASEPPPLAHQLRISSGLQFAWPRLSALVAACYPRGGDCPHLSMTGQPKKGRPISRRPFSFGGLVGSYSAFLDARQQMFRKEDCHLQERDYRRNGQQDNSHSKENQN
jgi:hypothetical protein